MVISSQEFIEVWEEEAWDPFEESVEGESLSTPTKRRRWTGEENGLGKKGEVRSRRGGQGAVMCALQSAWTESNGNRWE